MHLKPIKPRQALNKAYLKTKVTREAIEDFKRHLGTLLDSLQGKESEEHYMKHVTAFLEGGFYKQSHHRNAKGDIDLVVHTGKSPKDPVGVMVEAKRPDKDIEMFAAEGFAGKDDGSLANRRALLDENEWVFSWRYGLGEEVVSIKVGQ